MSSFSSFCAASASDQREDAPARDSIHTCESSCSFSKETEVAKRIALLYGQTKLSDVTFCLEAHGSPNGPVCFPAHRNVVSVWSEPLDAMLTGAFSEGESKEVVIRDVCPLAFEAMLKFMYTGVVQMDIDNVLSLLDVSGRFDVKPIVDFCVLFLQRHTTAEYACQMLEVGVRYSLNLLIDKCVELIVTDEHVLASDDFLKLSRDCMMMMVAHDSWNLHEDEIFDCILRWADTNAPDGSADRTDYMKPIVEGIRFPHMSVSKLRTLSSSAIVPLQLIFDALFFKLHSEPVLAEVFDEHKQTCRYRPRPGSVLFGWCPTPKITVSGEYLESVRHTSSNGFTGVRGNRRMVRGTYCWTIDIVETQSSWIFIGICPQSDPNDVAWRSTGRMIYCLDSRYFHQGSGQNHPMGDRKIGNGDRITVLLDSDAHTLSFGINKQKPIVLFHNLPEGVPWVPAVDLRDCGDKVRLLTNNPHANTRPGTTGQRRFSMGPTFDRDPSQREARHPQQPRQARDSTQNELQSVVEH
eukprot:GEMP01038833.1.p1 GENE.GEMP01038833.1~~GEMP01038833.1.p1  ORF type:complete len:532 (+),score=97.33 GEMP01038833.1:30-1598(+)